MPQAKIVSDTKARMEKAIEAVRNEMSHIRTGKASPALLDIVRVEYYGSKVPLNQVATVAAPEPRLLTVQPWDPGVIGDIEKAIQASDLGLTPNSDGQVIRLSIPELSEDRRKDLVRVIRQLAEDGRISIRNARRDANDSLKKLEKSGDIAEDVRYRTEKTVQELTDDYSKTVDNVLEAKEADIMEV